MTNIVFRENRQIVDPIKFCGVTVERQKIILDYCSKRRNFGHYPELTRPD